MVLCGFRLKKKAISPNCKSASIMPTLALVFLEMAMARLAIRVVLPLFPLGLKKVITLASFPPAAGLLKAKMASSSSSEEKGFTKKHLAPAFT